jgi:hypothetical protein
VDLQKTLTITVGPWADDVVPLLSASAHDDLVNIDSVARLVAAGAADLYRVHDAAALVCSVVVRVQQCDHGREAVIVAAGACLSGFSMTRTIVPELERHYAAAGCRRLRIHASRRGMERELERQGYGRQAVIYTKEIGHVF